MTKKITIFLIIAIIFQNGLILSLYDEILPCDDAYITFRYAENIAEGFGWVYNKGEVTSGTTSFLNTSLIALLSYIFKIDAATVGRIVPIILTSIILLLIVKILIILNFEESVIIIFIISYLLSPRIYRMALSGMESNLFVLFMLLVVYSFLKNKIYLSYLISGILIFIRIDGLIFELLLFISLFFIKSKFNTKMWLFLILALPLIIYIFINLYFFKFFIPLSVYAKMIFYSNHESVQTRFIALIHFFGGKLLPFILPFSIIGYISLLKENKNDTIKILFLFPFLWILLFTIVNPMLRDWYYFPPYPFLLILNSLGINNSFYYLSKYHFIFKTDVKYVKNFFIALFCTILIIYFTEKTILKFGMGKNEYWVNRDIILTTNVLKNLPDIKNKSIFLGDIGFIGFETKAKIIDYVGLVYPKALKYIKYKRLYTNGYNIDWKKINEFIDDEKPDILVFYPFYSFYISLTDSGTISINYKLINTISGWDIWLKK